MSGLAEPVPAAAGELKVVQWSAIFAGAIVTVGISLALSAFGGAIGLSIVSVAPTWRDSSPWLAILSGLFLLFMALCGFGFGGYVAGRLGQPLHVRGGETEFRDGMYGILAWASAVVITGFFAIVSVSTLVPTSNSAAHSSEAASPTGETLLATELDEFFRSTHRDVMGNIAYRRAEAARILLKTSSHSGVSNDDRAYLTILVANQIGLPDAEAADRVNRVIYESGQDLHRARLAAVLQAFMVAAALFVGAAVAWFSAVEGGKEREEGRLPVWDWSFRRRMA